VVFGSSLTNNAQLTTEVEVMLRDTFGSDIGVVCNIPNRDGPVVLPMSGDVGS
jgi:hypothetical protein